MSDETERRLLDDFFIGTEELSSIGQDSVAMDKNDYPPSLSLDDLPKELFTEFKHYVPVKVMNVPDGKMLGSLEPFKLNAAESKI